MLAVLRPLTFVRLFGLVPVSHLSYAPGTLFLRIFNLRKSTIQAYSISNAY